MKLFGNFRAVKFPEENLIFVTHEDFLYYIYDPKNKLWRKYHNAGNDSITVANYPDVSKDELVAAMQGVFPKKETDFMRLCRPAQLCIGDMLNLFSEDYAHYMSDYHIYHAVHNLLLESDICHKSFEELKKLFDKASANRQAIQQVLGQIKELCFRMTGRDIFKKEIGIVDGHNSSSYFWIMPVRVIDYENTASRDNVAEMRSVEISIEEDDVAQYLTPFLYKYFDENLEANKNRQNVTGFEWYLEHNFFTYDSMRNVLRDIKDTIDAFSSEQTNEHTVKFKKKRGTSTYQLDDTEDLTEEQTAEHNANKPHKNDTKNELILDFYRRFIYRMEYMIKVGEEKGYDLISFMGP